MYIQHRIFHYIYVTVSALTIIGRCIIFQRFLLCFCAFFSYFVVKYRIFFLNFLVFYENSVFFELGQRISFFCFLPNYHLFHVKHHKYTITTMQPQYPGEMFHAEHFFILKLAQIPCSRYFFVIYRRLSFVSRETFFFNVISFYSPSIRLFFVFVRIQHLISLFAMEQQKVSL